MTTSIRYPNESTSAEATPQRPKAYYLIAAVSTAFIACAPAATDDTDAASIEMIRQNLDPAPGQPWNKLFSNNTGLIIINNQSYTQSRMVISYHRCISGEAQAPSVSCQVAADEVLVGGSAYASGTSEKGAFLTASYPDTNLTTWTARSKDHAIVNPHKVYAIAYGMKLLDPQKKRFMTRAELLPFLRVKKQTSASSRGPSLLVGNTPSNEWQLSVGAKVNWSGAGNMLWAIHPLSVDSTDYQWISPATLEAYEILIKKVLPVGTLTLVDSVSTWSSETTGLLSANVRYHCFTGSEDACLINPGNGGPADTYKFLPVGAFGVAHTSSGPVGRFLQSHGHQPGRGHQNGFETWSRDVNTAVVGESQTKMHLLRIE